MHRAGGAGLEDRVDLLLADFASYMEAQDRVDALYRQPGECVRGLSLGSGQRASFLIFNNLTFTFDSKCTLVLQQTSNQSLRDNTAAYSDGAEVLWQGGRRADRHEVFRLLRIPSPR
mgnify:CR=1 FL=1